MSGVYIHIPFCHSKCAYCDFYSTPRQEAMSDYVYALLKEWDARHNELTEPVTTVYLGGGTPSLLPPDMLSMITSVFKASDIEEFTIEANPEDITDQWAEHIIGSGINRVSLGIQSLVDRELTAVGRRHTAAEAVKAISTLRNAGITEISGDLIYGLPEQTADTWRYSLDTLAALGLPHISAYSLSYEEGTRLYARLLAGKIQETDEETVAAMYDYMTQTLGAAGYEHYEISNFAKPGHRARHNSSYWHFIPYLGLGPGAHSFDGKARRVNKADLRGYISAIGSGRTFYTEEDESPSDLLNDYIITGLRTMEGIDLNDMALRFGAGHTESFMGRCRPYVKNGSLTKHENRICFDEKSWLVSDGVLRELIY